MFCEPPKDEQSFKDEKISKINSVIWSIKEDLKKLEKHVYELSLGKISPHPPIIYDIGFLQNEHGHWEYHTTDNQVIHLSNPDRRWILKIAAIQSDLASGFKLFDSEVYKLAKQWEDWGINTYGKEPTL